MRRGGVIIQGGEKSSRGSTTRPGYIVLEHLGFNVQPGDKEDSLS